jgi:hypothetical protein
MYYYMKKGFILVSLFILAVLLLGSQVLNLNLGPGPVRPVSRPKLLSGWDMIQPNASAITFNPRTQIFSAVFDNQVGRDISVSTLEASEKYTNASCGVMINGELVDPAKVIANGSRFKIEGICDGKSRKTGEAYRLQIKIGYTALIGFINTEYKENGLIAGEYD